jgi:hypothetical protein
MSAQRGSVASPWRRWLNPPTAGKRVEGYQRIIDEGLLIIKVRSFASLRMTVKRFICRAQMRGGG